MMEKSATLQNRANLDLADILSARNDEAPIAALACIADIVKATRELDLTGNLDDEGWTRGELNKVWEASVHLESLLENLIPEWRQDEYRRQRTERARQCY